MNLTKNICTKTNECVWNPMRVMEALWVIVLQMSTQKQCHEFIVVAMSGRAAAASELAVSANECPSESHQLCRAYRRAPCGRRRPLLYVIFPRAIFRNFPNNLQWCFALTLYLKTYKMKIIRPERTLAR